MHIVTLQKEHLQEALELALGGHVAEKANVNFLPARLAEHYLPLLEGMLAKAPGAAALDDHGQLIGYIIGRKVPNFKGPQRGVFVPEWANAATGPNRVQVMQHLYENISTEWVKNGCFTHALTLYAHDHLALNTWFHGTFGIICGDGLRELLPINGHLAEDVRIRRASVQDIDFFLPLVHEQQRYYPQAPMFMPLLELDDRLEYEHWLADDRNALWLALDGNDLIGYFQSSPAHPRASHLIDDPSTCSICGAYVKSDSRQGGVGTALLNRVIDWAKGEGYRRCAVDFETNNIYGSRFWHKHFTPVAYSVIRTVDERVAWAHSQRSSDSVW